MHTYGERLRFLRELRGLTQLELAAAAGTSQANVSRWERSRHAPGEQHARALDQALGAGVAEHQPEPRSAGDPDNAEIVRRYQALRRFEAGRLWPGEPSGNPG